MSHHEAVNHLVRYLQSNVAKTSIDEQIVIYQSLAVLMPTQAERIEADRIAYHLLEARKLQLDFYTRLFDELGWPGHQHNGEGSLQ